MARFTTRAIPAFGAGLLAFTLTLAATQPQQHAPGTFLQKGMRLIYGSGGTEQPAWVVDSVDFSANWKQGYLPCSYIRFGATDVRRLCQTRDTLFSWNEMEARLVPVRPVGARMSLRQPTRSGGHVLYETDEPRDETVQGYRIHALPTTVTTFDASGRVLRRLRERYAPALATALDGVFEVPDSARPGQWLVQREFTLLRIEAPSR